jgi:hypothetical protein
VLYRETATGAFALGVVGSGFPVKSHREFFEPIQDMLVSKLPGNVLDGAEVKPKVAHGGAFALLDITFPNSKVTIETRQGWRTDVAMRLIAWHGLAGSHSNNPLWVYRLLLYERHDRGRLQRGEAEEHEELRPQARSSARSNGSKRSLLQQARDLQVMATTHCSIEQGNAAIDAILGNTDRRIARSTGPVEPTRCATCG